MAEKPQQKPAQRKTEADEPPKDFTNASKAEIEAECRRIGVRLR